MALSLGAGLLVAPALGAQRPIAPPAQDSPNAVTKDVYVTGVFTFTTNGNVRYLLNEKDSSTWWVKEEHSSWRITYDSVTGVRVNIHALKWIHREVTEKTFKTGDISQEDTIDEDVLEGDSKKVLVGPKLLITHVTYLKRRNYRRVALINTTPEIIVTRTRSVVRHHRDGTVDRPIAGASKRFPLQVFLDIRDW